MQGGEKVGQAKAGEHKKITEDTKVVGKVYPSKVVVKPTVVSAALVMSTVTTTVPISKPISKGIVIEKQSDVSSSKNIAPSIVKDKGKGVMVE